MMTLRLLFLVLYLYFTLPVVDAMSVLENRDVTSTSKAGLAWPNGPYDDISQFTRTGKVSWYYSWSPQPHDDDEDLEFVPMLWGERQVEEFSSTINETISDRDIRAILAMNEPNQEGQADMSADDGADMWRTYLEPLRSSRNVRLGSPAPTSAPSGNTWLQDFLTACNGGCTVDFIALHWYDINATDFQEYLTDFHNTFQLPIWVTEWACQNFNDADLQCSEDDTVLFLNSTQSFMDETDWVERYSYFGAMRDMQGVNEANALMDDDGDITDLGRQYIGQEGSDTDGSGNPDGPEATAAVVASICALALVGWFV